MCYVSCRTGLCICVCVAVAICCACEWLWLCAVRLGDFEIVWLCDMRDTTQDCTCECVGVLCACMWVVMTLSVYVRCEMQSTLARSCAL